MDKLVFYWWGVGLYVDEAKTQQIIQQLEGGAGATAIAGIFSNIPGVPSSLISGICWLAGFCISIADAAHRGVIFEMTWCGLPWVSSQ